MMRMWEGDGIQGDLMMGGRVGAGIVSYQLVPRKLVSQSGCSLVRLVIILTHLGGTWKRTAPLGSPVTMTPGG